MELYSFLGTCRIKLVVFEDTGSFKNNLEPRVLSVQAVADGNLCNTGNAAILILIYCYRLSHG